MIDRSGKFAFDLEREEFQHKEFMQKMVDYSSMTWSEVTYQEAYMEIREQYQH